MNDRTKFNKYEFDTWSNLVEYDPTSPSHLTRKTDIFAGEHESVAVAKKGDVAGWRMKDGYFRVKHDGRSYAVSRIVWVLHNKSIPQGMFVDHIDGDRANNNIENLRLVSRKHNNQNRGLHSNNKSGVVGVRLDTYRPTNPYWVASWYDILGKNHSKWFSIKKYGDSAFDLACKYRSSVIEELNQNGADYSDRHGG